MTQDFSLFTRQSNSGNDWYLEVWAKRNNTSTTHKYWKSTCRFEFASTSGLDFSSGVTDMSSGWTDLNSNYGSATITEYFSQTPKNFSINFSSSPGSYSQCVDWPSGQELKVVRVKMNISDKTSDSGVNWFHIKAATSAYVMTSSNSTLGNDRNTSTYFDFPAPNPNHTLPVQLIAFWARSRKSYVCLYWETATEVNNYGFEIQRKNKKDRNWLTIGFKEGKGTSNVHNKYMFIDSMDVIISQNFVTETVRYRLKQIDRDGSYSYSPEIEVPIGVANTTELGPNYPNPFHTGTNIRYQLKIDSHVKLVVRNLFDQEIRTLVDGFQKQGSYNYWFEAKNLNPGLYIVTLTVGDKTETRKMVLSK